MWSQLFLWWRHSMHRAPVHVPAPAPAPPRGEWVAPLPHYPPEIHARELLIWLQDQGLVDASPIEKSEGSTGARSLPKDERSGRGIPSRGN